MMNTTKNTKFVLQLSICILLMSSAVDIAGAQETSPEVTLCGRQCKESHKVRVQQCLDQSGARDDSSQREAFAVCMADYHEIHRQCIQTCKAPRESR